LAIFGATLTGVTVVTLLLIRAIVPQATAEQMASVPPGFDLAVAPDRTGGSLAFTGDRSGVLQLDRLTGGVDYGREGDHATIVQREFRYSGDNGQIAISRDREEGITLIEYDGLSFYLDAGDCEITLGERNASVGLIIALIECKEISDIRGGGVVSAEGVVALPGDVFGDRGDLPESGGRVMVGDTSVEFTDAIVVGGGLLGGSGRMPLSVHGNGDDSILGMEYDPETAAIVLTGIYAIGRESAHFPQPCPVTAEDLGDLNPFTPVIRFTIDCDNAVLPDGTSTTVEGTVVADSDVNLDIGNE